MQSLRRNWGSALLAGAALALLFGVSACTDDLYASCSLEPNSRCENPEETGISCVEEQNLQCETQVCARYVGSQPFCTTSCEVDGDCPGGFCRTFGLDASVRYCVEETDA